MRGAAPRVVPGDGNARMNEPRSICWYEGRWHDGDTPLMGSTTHAAWLGSVVFDGARAFEGLAPDLDRHCARAVRSAEALHMRPPVDAARIESLAREGILRFPPGEALYIRPMFWVQDGLIAYDPESTRFALVITRMPLPDPAAGFTACLSSYRRPAPDQAPTQAKASCLYPLASLAVFEARARGFDNAVLRDPKDNVAEFTAQNLFMVKDGVCSTPAPNGTFLAGITRQRVIALLRETGTEVVERTISPDELLAADEIFATGNHGKVTPCLRYEGAALAPGPCAARARALYWEWARATAPARR
jgi:branched-chain amino acid aminotransferase